MQAANVGREASISLLISRYTKTHYLCIDIASPSFNHLNLSFFDQKRPLICKNFKLQYQNFNKRKEALKMTAHRPASNQTFESIKQKYSKNVHTNSLSPYKSLTQAPLKENLPSKYDSTKLNPTDRGQINIISPLSIKYAVEPFRAANLPDVSQLKIDQIKQKLRDYNTSRQQYMTDRAHSQRALNKESIPSTKRSFYLDLKQDQTDLKSKYATKQSNPTNAKNETVRLSPISKYMELKVNDECLERLDRLAEEKQAKYRRQREESQQTISSIQIILKNIKATLSASHT